MRIWLLSLVAGASAAECQAESCEAGPASAPQKEEGCGCSSLGREGGQLRAAEVAAPLAPAALRHNEDMVEIPAGRFLMGDRKDRVHFPQDGEGPVRPVRMSGFFMDRFEVSNAKFRAFAEAAQYVTDAERLGDSFVAEVYLSEAVSASIHRHVNVTPWWLPTPQAFWRSPEGVDSSLEESKYGLRWDHPVVHMSWNDANAYCRWRNASLPTEAQWEYAARGGLEQKLYPWGDTMYGNQTEDIEAKYRMNIWQGQFPTENTAEDGYVKTAPVDAYGPQNDWGLYNMVGNAWEWTSDWWSPVHFLTEETKETGLVDPLGPTEEELEELVDMGILKKDASGAFEKTKRGGSFMCHHSYCYRYRVMARSHLTVDSSAHHLSMRCVRPKETAG